MNRAKPFLTFSALLILSLPTLSDHAAAQEGKPKDSPPIPEPKVFETKHAGTFNGQRIAYTARAGETYLKDEQGKPVASIFSFSYLKDDVQDPSSRPVTFIFNGGPGSASLWLHMGAFGPKRVVVPSQPEDDGAPPYPTVDNVETILDLSDLVFIDPVGTGFSHALGDTDPKTFYGVTEDARSLAQFVRIWIRENQRWNSPKYIAGESYGTTRAAAMANQLELSTPTVSLNGLVLISNFQSLEGATFQPGNEMGYITYLPSYAATAWYHGKVKGAPRLEPFLEQARSFALGDYAHALLMGTRLAEQQRERIVKRLAHFTGLSEDYIRKADLRINYPRFQKELLRDRGLVVGRLDSRYTGEEVDDAGETPSNDFSGSAIGGAFTAAVNDYMGRVLGVKMDREYVTSGGLWNDWKWELPDWSSFGDPVSFNTAPYVGRAMRRNKDLRVLVASGYYDFATPFFDAENNFSRNGVVPERIRFTYYEAGHMMYLHEPSRLKFMSDTRQFIQPSGITAEGAKRRR